MNINEYNETVRVLCLFIFLGHTGEGICGRKGEGSVYYGQHTDVIESMTNDVSTDSGGVSVSVSLHVSVSGDEEDQDESTESTHVDVEEVVDEINHETLSKEVFHSHSPCRRAQRSPV